MYELPARYLISYFKRVYEKAGLKWDNDNSVEITDIVIDIIQIATEEAVKEIERKQAVDRIAKK